MTDFAAVKSAIEKQNDALDVFVKAQRARIDSQDERIAELLDRIEEKEAYLSGPGKAGAPAGRRAAAEHVKAFGEWMRAPKDPAKQSHLKEMEGKAITIASPAGGGYAVPEEISREIDRLEKLFSPVRNLVKVVRASTSDYKALVNIRGATAGWAGESTDRSAGTATPQLRERVPSWGEVFAYPQTSNWALDDVFFDLPAWLAEEVSQEFAISEGTAVISGNGSNKPTGMLNTSPSSLADFNSPMRDANAYQFVPSLSTSSPVTAEVEPDALLDLVYSLKSQYRARGTFVMNSTTMAAVRKLKDNDGNYLWAAGLQSGQPDRLLGYPVVAWEQMEDIATNAHPIAFGDFMRGYLLVEHAGGLKITVDEVTNPGHTKYYIRRREAGTVLNGDAVKFLKTTIA